jgi:hypothetical protein
MRLRLLAPFTLAALAACSGNPPPVLPQAPPDVQGQVSAIQGSFAGGGSVSVRPAQAAADAPVDRVELRPGARVLERRAGRVRWSNLSRLKIGDRVAAWWDGEPTVAAPPRQGPVRILLIERT